MRQQNPEDKMTDRELVGVILSGGGPAALRAPSSDSEKPVASFCTPSRGGSRRGSKTHQRTP